MGSSVSGLFRKIWDLGGIQEENGHGRANENGISNLLHNYKGSIFILKRVRYANHPMRDKRKKCIQIACNTHTF